MDPEQDIPDPDNIADPICHIFMNGLWKFPLAIKLAVSNEIDFPPTESMLRSGCLRIDTTRRAKKLSEELDNAEDAYSGAKNDTKTIIGIGICEGLSDMLVVTRNETIEEFRDLPVLRFRLSDSNCWMFKLSEFSRALADKLT